MINTVLCYFSWCLLTSNDIASRVAVALIVTKADTLHNSYDSISNVHNDLKMHFSAFVAITFLILMKILPAQAGMVSLLIVVIIKTAFSAAMPLVDTGIIDSK